jgi:hypothetical protein
MAWVVRKTVRLPGRTRVNVSKSGLSLSKTIGRLTVNSRGRASIRILPGLSYRFGKRR